MSAINLSLAPDCTSVEAADWLRALIRDIGIGFHPDTSPRDYVDADGLPLFSPKECDELSASLTTMFAVLGESRPYEICLDWALMDYLVTNGTRDQLIRWLIRNDSNGIYTDADSIANEMTPLTLDGARRLIQDQLTRE